MSNRKSESVAEEAFEKFRDGEVRDCIHDLVNYADTHVNNMRTARIFKEAIDSELSDIKFTVIEPDEDAPQCVHCGSTSTYFRQTDGDVGCNECPGIMPQGEEVEG